jgi:hypothetical protein
MGEKFMVMLAESGRAWEEDVLMRTVTDGLKGRRGSKRDK